MGIEATPKFARIIREKGLSVHEGVLATFEPHSGSYDLVVMVDVLEHFADPIADLQRCRRLLHPDGRIVVATCDIGR